MYKAIVTQSEERDEPSRATFILIFFFLESSSFGYMLSSQVAKVVNLRFLWSLGWLHAYEFRERFADAQNLSVKLGDNF